MTGYSYELRPRMELRTVQIHEIFQIVKDTSPFRGKNIKEDDITAYLTEVNGYLVKGDTKDGLALEDHIITASSIYSFVKPLLEIDIPENVEKFYIKTLKKSYKMKEPLGLYFKDSKTDKESTCDICSAAIDKDSLESTRDVAKERKRFKRSDRFKEIIRKELYAAKERLTEHYNNKGFFLFEEHYLFIGYDVCAHIFNADRKSGLLDELHELLKEKSGIFYIRLPGDFCS